MAEYTGLHACPLAVEQRLQAAPPPVAHPDWVLDTGRHDTRGLLHLSTFPSGAVPGGSELTRSGWHYGEVRTIMVTRDQPQAGDYTRVCKDCALVIRRWLRGDLVAGVDEGVGLCEFLINRHPEPCALLQCCRVAFAECWQPIQHLRHGQR